VCAVYRLIFFYTIWKWLVCNYTVHSPVTDASGGHVITGSVLQIVSAPGQPYLRAPGPVVMQTVSQAGAVHSTLGSKPPTSGPSPAPLTPQGRVF
jgi:hypothetical protein